MQMIIILSYMTEAELSTQEVKAVILMVEQVYGKHSPDYLRRAVNSLKMTKIDTFEL